MISHRFCGPAAHVLLDMWLDFGRLVTNDLTVSIPLQGAIKQPFTVSEEGMQLMQGTPAQDANALASFLGALQLFSSS